MKYTRICCGNTADPAILVENGKYYLTVSSFRSFPGLKIYESENLTEWKKINASNAKKIISFFTFPLFMFTYLPVMAGSIFSKPEWKPIKHHAVDENNRIIRQKKSGRKFRYRRKIFGDK